MKQKTFEDVTMRDIETLAQWASPGPVPVRGRLGAARLAKRARNRGNNGHFAALKQIAAMINERRGPWAGPMNTEEGQ